jgi:hypothetical protein
MPYKKFNWLVLLEAMLAVRSPADTRRRWVAGWQRADGAAW